MNQLPDKLRNLFAVFRVPLAQQVFQLRLGQQLDHQGLYDGRGDKRQNEQQDCPDDSPQALTKNAERIAPINNFSFSQ